MDIVITSVHDFDALGEQWRDLEERADGSFFQGWTWLGCLARHRFDNPILVTARQSGRIVALGLLNRRKGSWFGSRLLLSESGEIS